MRLFSLSITLVLLLSYVSPSFGAKNLKPSADNIYAGGKKKKKAPEPSKSKKGKANKTSADTGTKSQRVENDEFLFKPKKKSWSIAPHIGYPYLQADISSRFGYAGGLFIQRALGYSVAMRLNFVIGVAYGANWQGNGAAVFQDNFGMNGGTNSSVDYFHQGKGGFLNYKNKFDRLTFDVVYNIHNINFMKENPRFSIYAIVGAGAFLFTTFEDQLDGNGNMYDYSKINAKGTSKKDVLKQLKTLRDGTYESKNDFNSHTATFLGKYVTPAFDGGLGLQYKLNERLNLFGEVTYTYTGNDLLDGYRWYNPGVPTPQPDAFYYFGVGVNIRLGRTDKVYWFSNPLSMPFKAIMEAKQKLGKVDKMEKDLDKLKGKVDTLRADVDSLKTDSDGDGVSDYFDKEDNTPAGAIVNGSGQTIFYKDNDGNMVFVDPNTSDEPDSTGTGIMVDANGNPMNADGSSIPNKKKKPGNNGGGDGGDVNGGDNGTFMDGSNNPKKGATKSKAKNGAGQTKTVFNPKKKKGTTIIAAGNGGNGGNGGTNVTNNNTNIRNLPGTNSSIGYLPAVFFETASAKLTKECYPHLYEVARAIHLNPGVKVHIVGYTDYRASDNYNYRLGMRRAESVAYALKNFFGVPAENLTIESKGKVEPLTNLKSMPALAANRRVQFEVEGMGTSKSKLKGDINNGSMKNSNAEKPVDKGTTPVKTKTVTKTSTKTTSKTTSKTTKPAVKKPELVKQKTEEIKDTVTKIVTPSDTTTVPATINMDQQTTPPANKQPADTTKKQPDILTPDNDF